MSKKVSQKRKGRAHRRTKILGWNFLPPGVEGFDPPISFDPPMSLEQAIPLWELLHGLMHSEPLGDVAFVQSEPDPVFEAEKELYLMLTYRLTLDARIP